MAHIVFNPFGSFGDLHPFLALAIELQRRGHRATIATSEVYRTKVEALGVNFAPVRPNIGDLLERPELLSKLWDRTRGTEYLIRDYLMPCVGNSYADLREASKQADLLLTHSAAYAGPIVAEAQKLRWLSVVLQPSIFLSIQDPPVLPVAWLQPFYRLGPSVIQALFALGRARVRSWCEPIFRLRRKLGLSAVRNPVFESQFSPHGTLALFSRYFAMPQPDWPAHTMTTGFVFYDQLGEGFAGTPSSREKMSSELAHFLDAGPAPVLFTLGSSAVMRPGNFFEESAKAARILGRRALLLVGRQERHAFSDASSETIFVADYAPYSQVMPRAAAIVHQGGIGTTAQALRAGRPMLIVPWAHDQPDNATRARHLGVARTLDRRRYQAAGVATELRSLLASSSYAQTAMQVSTQLAAENGTATACDAIEAALERGG